MSRWRPVIRELVRTFVVVAGVGLPGRRCRGRARCRRRRGRGEQFAAGDEPGVRYSRAQCAEYREHEPDARTCREAAASHHFSEIVERPAAAGVVGLIVLGAVFLWRRRHPAPPPSILPDAFAATVGATVFGAAAAAFGAELLGKLVAGTGSGAGWLLAGAVVAGAVAAVYARVVLRTLLANAARMAAWQPGGVG